MRLCLQAACRTGPEKSSSMHSMGTPLVSGIQMKVKMLRG